MTAKDHYYVRITFLMSSGDQGFVEAETQATEFEMPAWAYDSAQSPDRWTQWTVQVRRRNTNGTVVELSPQSAQGLFYWR